MKLVRIAILCGYVLGGCGNETTFESGTGLLPGQKKGKPAASDQVAEPAPAPTEEPPLVLKKADPVAMPSDPPANQAPVFVSTPSRLHPLIVDFDDQVALPGVFRDFRDSHPDFEFGETREKGLFTGMVSDQLNSDMKPTFVGAPLFAGVTNQQTFSQWYQDQPGINCRVDMELILQRVMNTSIFTLESDAFFPLDQKCFGNQGRDHNFHFTLEISSEFRYRGDETFRFRGDDDLFVYINQHLVVEVGGVHNPEEGSVQLADVADEIGLEVGKVYSFRLFFAERHTSGSNFRIDTSILLGKSEPYVYPIAVVDPDGDPTFLTLLKGPPGMSLDPVNQLLVWDADIDDLGDHEVVLEVKDDQGARSEQRYRLFVKNE